MIRDVKDVLQSLPLATLNSIMSESARMTAMDRYLIALYFAALATEILRLAEHRQLPNPIASELATLARNRAAALSLLVGRAHTSAN